MDPAKIHLAAAVFALFLSGCRKAPPPAKKTGPSAQKRVRNAIRRGLGALCRFPDRDIRHDTGMVFSLVRKSVAFDGLEKCYKRVTARAAGDRDHPLGFLVDPALAKNVNLEGIRKLPIPGPGRKRTNVNHIVFRAAHCKKVPFPEAAFAYLSGPMRDNGGFHSTHALWALLMLRDRGCFDRRRVDGAVTALQKELWQALVKNPAFEKTRDIDLGAERILFLLESGSDPGRLAPYVEKLLSAQRKDGTFAAPGEKQTRWLVHSTSVSVWALTAYHRTTRKH